MIECHFCGVVYELRGVDATHATLWHVQWQQLTQAGWVFDDERLNWKCDTCQKEEGDTNALGE